MEPKPGSTKEFLLLLLAFKVSWVMATIGWQRTRMDDTAIVVHPMVVIGSAAAVALLIVLTQRSIAWSRHRVSAPTSRPSFWSADLNGSVDWDQPNLPVGSWYWRGQEDWRWRIARRTLLSVFAAAAGVAFVWEPSTSRSVTLVTASLTALGLMVSLIWTQVKTPVNVAIKSH